MSKKNSLMSQSKIESPNLELSSIQDIKKILIINKNNVNNIDKKQDINSLNIFKKLIIITSIIFSFGGLGFGLALRYGQNFDIYQSKNSPVDNSYY